MNQIAQIEVSHDSTAAIKALVAAQKEMGKAVKSANNPHFKAKYADLSSVRDACFPALNANGFAIMQPGGVDESGEYVETVFLHETGVSFTTRIYLKIGKGDMQGYGSAITYARRYGLLSLSGLAPEDDDGNAAAKQPPAVVSNTISVTQYATIRDKLTESGADQAAFLSWCKVDRLEDLPAIQFDKALAALDQKIKEKGNA